MSDVTVDAAEPGSAGGGRRTSEIRQVAADLFKSRGYSATTMTHIAEAAGVFPGSLYHHFASKEEIAVEILEQLDEDLNTVVETLPERGAVAPEERLLELVTRVMAVSQRNAAAIRLRAFEPPTVATQRLHDAQARRDSTLEAAWKEAIDDLVPRDPSTPVNADLLRFALQDLSYNTAGTFPLDADPTAIARNTVDLLLYGIAAVPPSDEELDTSDAMRAANDAMSRWPERRAAPDDDVRAQIIAAARAEFARRGYDATTIRDVAKAAEVRMGSLYRRVKSKEDMVVEIIGSFNEHFNHAIQAVFAAGDSEVASLDAMAKVFVRGRRRFREEADMTMFSWRVTAGDGTPFGTFRTQTDSRLALVVDLVARGVARGTLRDINSAREIAPHLRYPCWVPYEDSGTTAGETHRFLRDSVLRGYARSV